MVEALQAAVTTQLVGLKEFHVVQHCLVREREIPECSDVVGEVLVAVREVHVAVEKMLALKFPVVAAECSVVVAEFPAFVVQVLLEEVPVVVEQSHLDT